VIDDRVALLALRARLTGLSAMATTGTMALAATTTGYTRSDGGSFITDGFRIGMELLSSGFATNGYRTVKALTASTITVDQTLTAESSAGSRSLSVGLPETRLWVNSKPVRSGVQLEAPTNDRPYILESFIKAGGANLKTFPANGGETEERGMYIVHWFGLSNRGPDAILEGTAAILARFTPGTPVTAGSDVLRMGSPDGREGPWADEIRPLANGWSVSTIRVPWWARSVNAVAA
jgi:hypothetical protein